MSEFILLSSEWSFITFLPDMPRNFESKLPLVLLFMFEFGELSCDKLDSLPLSPKTLDVTLLSNCF